MLISFHSYKGGTGKTNITGNLGKYLAKKKHKVCIIDTDVNGSGLHSLFNLKFNNSLIEFLRNECDASEIIYKPEDDLDLYIIPTRVWEEDLTSFFKTPSETREKVNQLIDFVKQEYGIEHILFDCSPGINKSSMLVMNLVDTAIIVSTIDRQDIRGTYLLTNVAKKLGANVHLLFNKIPPDKPEEITDLILEFSKKLNTDLLGSIEFDTKVAETWSRRLVIDNNLDCGYCNQIRAIASDLGLD